MTADEDLHALREDYRAKGWLIGRREPHVFYAVLMTVPRGQNGLMDLHDPAVAGLRARVEEFERVFAETGSRDQAEAAANALRT